MRALSPAELLDAWEQGFAQPPLQRAVTLLSNASPEVEPETLARLSIGERDARLMELRESTFGPHVSAMATCPSCGEQVEFGFAIEDVHVRSDGGRKTEIEPLKIGDYEVRYRLPNSVDLLAIGPRPEAAAATRFLIQRCLLSAKKNADKIAADDLPEHVITALEQEMSKLDPQANVQLSLDCPGCHNRWSAPFDILAFFWNELNAWAQRLLLEVHALASAYGWTEPEIVGLSPARRSIYLNMIGR